MRLRVRWKVASDLRFRVAISEAETRSFCGISGDLAPSKRKSLAIAIVRFWRAKGLGHYMKAFSKNDLPLDRSAAKVVAVCARNFSFLPSFNGNVKMQREAKNQKIAPKLVAIGVRGPFLQ